MSSMNGPNPSRWAGMCAGGFFAAAAGYGGNVVGLATVRSGVALLLLVMGALPVICVVMGCLVLAGRRRAPRWAVVVAGGFCAVHLIGLAYLFLLRPGLDSVVTRSLQWQLGTAFVLLWLTVLGFAFRLAKGVEAWPHSPTP
jgi:hypothetical protein